MYKYIRLTIIIITTQSYYSYYGSLPKNSQSVKSVCFRIPSDLAVGVKPDLQNQTVRSVYMCRCYIRVLQYWILSV